MNPNQSNPTSQAENSLFNKKTVLLAVVITILVIGLIPTRLLRNYLSSTPTPAPTAEISANTPTPAPPTPTIAEPDPTAEPTEPSPPEPSEEPTAEPTEEPTPSSTSKSPAASFTPPDAPTPSPTPTDTPETPTPTHTPETPVVVAQPCPIILLGPPNGERFRATKSITLTWQSPSSLGVNQDYLVFFRTVDGKPLAEFLTDATSSIKPPNPSIDRWPVSDDYWLDAVRINNDYQWGVKVVEGQTDVCVSETKIFTWGLN